jgi:hypothetical protein
LFDVRRDFTAANDQSMKLGPSRLPRAGKDWCFYSAGEKNIFIRSRYAGREYSRSFDLRFERFERGRTISRRSRASSSLASSDRRG